APVSLSATSLANPYVAGTVSAVTVTALDIYGNRATSYTGTIHVSSSDPKASLPADFTLTAASGGTVTFLATLKTAGTQSFSVTDTVNPAFASTQTGIVVVPGGVAVFVFSGVAPSTTAGSGLTFTLTAQDGFGNVTPFLGSIAFTSSDS